MKQMHKHVINTGLNIFWKILWMCNVDVFSNILVYVWTVTLFFCLFAVLLLFLLVSNIMVYVGLSCWFD